MTYAILLYWTNVRSFDHLLMQLHVFKCTVRVSGRPCHYGKITYVCIYGIAIPVDADVAVSPDWSSLDVHGGCVVIVLPGSGPGTIRHTRALSMVERFVMRVLLSRREKDSSDSSRLKNESSLRSVKHATKKIG